MPTDRTLIAAPIAEARVRAIAIVAANQEAIRLLAGALEAAGELTGQQLRSAIDDAGFKHDVRAVTVEPGQRKAVRRADGRNAH